MPIDQFYFPNKVVNYTNFPELRVFRSDIETIMTYSLRVESALLDYNEARYDRVDVNMEELQSNIALCRTITSGLSAASNVCFDILLEVRSIQEELQKLVFLKRKFGSKVIGTPKSNASEAGGAV